MWHELRFFICGPKAHCRILHVLYWRENHEWKAPGADCRPVSTDVRRSNKMVDPSIWMSHLFFCVTLLWKFQTHCNSSWEKQFILVLWAWGCHHTGHHFIYPGQSKSRSKAFWMIRRKTSVNWRSAKWVANAMWLYHTLWNPWIQRMADHRLSQPGIAKPPVAA